MVSVLSDFLTWVYTLDNKLHKEQSVLFLAFPNIGILNLGFSNDWNCGFWLFQTLEFRILAFPNIGILNLGVSKHWNCQFWLFQRLEFSFLAFPNIGILNFGFSKL